MYICQDFFFLVARGRNFTHHIYNEYTVVKAGYCAEVRVISQKTPGRQNMESFLYLFVLKFFFFWHFKGIFFVRFHGLVCQNSSGLYSDASLWYELRNDSDLTD